jgi:hypothetical protein
LNVDGISLAVYIHMKHPQNQKNEPIALNINATPTGPPAKAALKKTILKSGTDRKQAHASSRNRRNQAKKDSKGEI